MFKFTTVTDKRKKIMTISVDAEKVYYKAFNKTQHSFIIKTLAFPKISKKTPQVISYLIGKYWKLFL